MAAFYFHNCYPDQGDIEHVLTVFKKWVNEYHCLVTSHDKIDRGIVTPGLPSEIKICGHEVSKLIGLIDDRNIKTKAHSIFTRGTINDKNNADIDLLTEDVINDSMTCLGYDASMLYYAFLNDYWATSIPLSSEYITGSLDLLKGDVKEVDIFNWAHAEQTALCEEKLKDPDRPYTEILVEFLSNCTIADLFEQQFNNLSPKIKMKIFKSILKLNEQQKLSPTVVVDNDKIKKCKGTNLNIYEIRLVSINYRVYFAQVNENMYLGSVMLKTPHQTNDIKHAEIVIENLIDNRK